VHDIVSSSTISSCYSDEDTHIGFSLTVCILTITLNSQDPTQHWRPLLFYTFDALQTAHAARLFISGSPAPPELLPVTCTQQHQSNCGNKCQFCFIIVQKSQTLNERNRTVWPMVFVTVTMQRCQQWWNLAWNCSSKPTTLTTGCSNGQTNARCCRYSDMSSWWWVQIPPETCRAVYRYKSTVYRCILLDNYWRIFMMHGPFNIKEKKKMMMKLHSWLTKLFLGRKEYCYAYKYNNFLGCKAK
jgi:hypothetical protein